MSNTDLQRYQGSCHCGAVRFEFEAKEPFDIEDCNCSICQKAGAWHMIIPRTRFRLLQGDDELATYRFNTAVAQHKFCRTCGIKSFYIPRSNPDGVSINARCIDGDTPLMNIMPFDGQNWEEHAHKLAHKSQSD